MAVVGLVAASIGRQAVVDTDFIYRHISERPELLTASAGERDFSLDNRELGTETQPGSAASPDAWRLQAVILAFGQALRHRHLTQDLTRRELLKRNEIRTP